jgi:hypothetical protein
MDLSESKFFYADHEMTFTVFSDFPCRARYVGTIPLPLTRDHVEIYEMEPAAGSQWVLVEQRDGDKVIQRLFLRKGNLFPETDRRYLPEELRKSLSQQLARLNGFAGQSRGRPNSWRRAP